MASCCRNSLVFEAISVSPFPVSEFAMAFVCPCVSQREREPIMPRYQNRKTEGGVGRGGEGRPIRENLRALYGSGLKGRKMSKHVFCSPLGGYFSREN